MLPALSAARSPLVAPAQFTTTSGRNVGDHRADRVRPAGEIERDVPGSAPALRPAVTTSTPAAAAARWTRAPR